MPKGGGHKYYTKLLCFPTAQKIKSHVTANNQDAGNSEKILIKSMLL